MKSIIYFVRVLAILGFTLFLAGWSWGGDEAEVKKVVLGSLKDPDSAKFGKFTTARDNMACLVVNAKNSMGGYTGDQIAFAKKVSGEWVLIGIYHKENILNLCAAK